MNAIDRLIATAEAELVYQQKYHQSEVKAWP